MVHVHEQRTIAASPERVLDWLLDPANLTVSRAFHKAVWAKGLIGSLRGSDAGSDRIWLLGVRTDHGLRSAPELLLFRHPLVPGPTTQWWNAHVHSVGRRHACRLGKRLLASGSRGRQGDRGADRAADPLAYLPRAILAGCAKALETET
jgi:hypothetical protein